MGLSTAVWERVGRHILVLICCAIAVSCRATEEQAGQATNRAAVVKIEWRNRCQQPASEVFFTVTVSARGEVQYEGLKEVRELGPRRTTIAKSRAKAILAKARAMVADIESRSPDPEVAGGECLRIQMQHRGDVATVEILSNTPAARALGTLLKESIRIQDWICPARHTVPERDFICGQPAVTYVLTEKHACQQHHVTDIYADGTAHYYVTQSGFPDQYSRIAPAQVVALTQFPADAPLEKLVVPGTTSRIFHVTGAYAIEYSDRLQQATRLELQTLPAARICDYGKEFPVGDLMLSR